MRVLLPPVFALGLIIACGEPPKDPAPPLRPPVAGEEALTDFANGYMDEQHIPGMAAAILLDDRVAWAGGWGWADVALRRPMTPETIINIASITKTVTNAAILQLRDAGRFTLDDPINDYLPSGVVHPRYRETPITFRHLLTHTAAVADGDAYDASYACGDPKVPLGEWIEGYFTPGGRYYDAGQNFQDWAPGEKYSYSNLGYGLLGSLVEIISGQSLADYTRRHLFEPLAMTSTGWYLTDVDLDRHATLYEWATASEPLASPLFGDRDGEVPAEDGFAAYCQYSFYNLSDGLLRTSVRELSRFLLAHMRRGELDGWRILDAETIEEIFRRQLDPERHDDQQGAQGLTWHRRDLVGGPVWEHGGADPGTGTAMLFSPVAGFGVIVFANRMVDVQPVALRLVDEARKLRESMRAGAQ